MSYLKLITASLFASTIALMAFQSCDKNEHGCGPVNIAKNGEDESHNMGKNCMNCHTDGGRGKGCFNVAGTIYDSLLNNTNPNGKVRLYTGPNGTGILVATVELDEKGNFFTTEIINFDTPLYPSVSNASGQTKYMGSSIQKGECNSCHGDSTDPIWTN